MRGAIAIPAALAGLMLAACGSSASPHSGPSASSSAPATASVPVTSASVTAPPTLPVVTASAPGSSTAPSGTSLTSAGPITQAQATAALLSAAQVGPGFAATAGDSTKTALPCAAKGSPPLEKQVPPQSDASSDYTQGQAAALHEEIYGFADAATAAKAYTVSAKGLSCASGTIYNQDGTTTPVKITDGSDIAGPLLVNSGMSWAIQTSQFAGGIFVVRFGARLIVMTFIAIDGTDPSTLPDSGAIVQTAVVKAAAAGS